MTNPSSFVHLHVHSEYSLLEAACGVKEIAQRAAQLEMPAVALTDNGNMFGAIEFFFACQDKGVKPILGLDAYLTENRLQKTQTPPARLVLLAKNYKGYQNLCRISSVGYQEGFYYKPRIDLSVLKENTADLIVLSSGLQGPIGRLFSSEGPDLALQKVRELQSLFPDHFYLEMQRMGLSENIKFNAFLQECAKITGVPLVASNDVHYIHQEDQIAQEVLVCIGTNKTLRDESRFRLGSDQFYFKSGAEMQKLFHDVPEALSNTLQIAEQIKIEFKLKDENKKPIYHLPSFPTTEGRSIEDEIRLRSEEGLRLRFAEAKARNEEISEEVQKNYTDRLHFELGVIGKMGFNGYFLIVADFINWAKEQNIPVGPGRGSGAGSLVAYSLKITDLDPMPYSLLFERFLNPERISMPDFDIDFCQDRRQEVIAYVTQKYGPKSVSQIITYGKLQTRAALKDVGRVLGMTFPEVDAVTKLIPEKLNITIDQAIEQEPRITEAMESDPQVSTLVDLAKRVEGMVRHAGIHAAGVIIASDELVKYAPLYKGADGENVVQYDMKHAEKIGLIKFDFLGLKTLTLIQRALDLIEKNRGLKITTQEISLSDPGIYELISSGDTLGIFQFEGDGITNAIRLIKPGNFFDITAINALYRPGPMAMIPEFAKRKHGEVPVEFIFSELSEILQETYGIIVYQEQVMGIASRIAGYSLGEADMLRRAMGKKIKEEMDQHRVRFLRGAKERGHDEAKSDELFDLMYKFADYGFNKSHAAAYCVVAAQTAWLKHYYRPEFFAATLSTELSDTDKVVTYVKDAQRHGLKVLPPHINHSEFLFTVKGQDIYYGLGAIKGVGESAINAILQARGQQPDGQFPDLETFFNSVDTKKLNKKVIESLIKAGAFDGFGLHRAQLFAGYTEYLNESEKRRKENDVGQASLLSMMDEKLTIKLPDTAPWGRTARSSYEKEVLGFYLSEHPLQGFDHLAKVWTTGFISDMPAIFKEHQAKLALDTNKQKYDFRNRDGNKKRVVVAGLVVEKRELITKKGTRMAFAKFEDLTASCELVIFPDAFAQMEGILSSDKPLLVGGFLDGDENTTKIIVDSMSLLQDAFSKCKRMVLHLDKVPEEKYPDLEKLLASSPGRTEVQFEMDLPELKKRVVLNLAQELRIGLSHEFLETLHSSMGWTEFLEMKI
jgi:DNA polymerase-3 subunit alpha